nr:MAG TPA_asm: hypothetical protein [Caudoviricetes sp.]
MRQTNLSLSEIPQRIDGFKDNTEMSGCELTEGYIL